MDDRETANTRLNVRQPATTCLPGLSLACVFASWAIVVVLGSLAALRLFYHDGTNLLVCFNAFTLYLYLPAYGVLAWAAWRRRWLLAALGGLIVLCHVAWIGPDFLPAARTAPIPAGSAAPSPKMRIFCANVRGTNANYQSMLDEIAEADPDVVVLIEYTGRWHQALKDSPILAPYAYRQPRPVTAQIACYSRLPLVHVEQPLVANSYCPILTIPLGNNLVRLFCLHSPRPTQRPWHDYDDFWARAMPLIAQQPEPLVVVGDFNATQHSRIYEQLASGRLRSAHDDRGRGYATTWPNGQYWLPPIRIDQALVSPDVECLGIVEGRGAGSDHKPLIFDVRLRHDRPAPADNGPIAGN
jgi:endonuclease/exonuclease/phosphatase (EEP) superfamily protein YafD